MSLADEVTVEAVEEAIGSIDKFAFQCHAASLALVKSGLLTRAARVARGSCPGIGGQHSWVVIGDPYDPGAWVVDITAWSYDEKRPRVWVTRNMVTHMPQWGIGSLWGWGRPSSDGGPEIELDWGDGPSPEARTLLSVFRQAGLKPDYKFWADLFSYAPHRGWPVGEFVKAGCRTKDVAALIPIDRVGMTTDLNPDGLYW